MKSDRFMEIPLFIMIAIVEGGPCREMVDTVAHIHVNVLVTCFLYPWNTLQIMYGSTLPLRKVFVTKVIAIETNMRLGLMSTPESK